MKRWWLSGGVRLWLFISLLGCSSIVAIQPGWAEIQPGNEKQELESRENSIQITQVVVNPTEKGVEVILQTTQGKALQPVTLALGRTYIANIPNAVLVLPQGEFRQDNPASGIARVAVSQASANSIRVTVMGETALPQVQLYDAPNEGLIFSFTPGTSAAQTPLTPQGENQQGKPLADEQEIVVTGEQDGYLVPDTNVGTRTDTPLRDIPQAIQVVPRQVLQDTQSRNLVEALENVPGVIPQGPGIAFSRTYLTVRGFENYSGLVNGLPDPQIFSDNIFFNVERIEALKGPTSVLYGDGGFGSLGGTVNYVTRRPLREPFFEVEANVGNHNFYEGTIDVSEPLNASKSALGRFIVGYRSDDSFIDFNSSSAVGFAPSLSFQLGSKSNLLVEGDLTIMERNEPGTLPVIGTILPNPNGKVRSSFNSSGPAVVKNLTYNGRIGYEFEHEFNENLILRNAFRYTLYSDDDRDNIPFASDLDADNRTLNREVNSGSQYYDYFLVDTNLLSKFRTGKVDHQVLFGFSLSRNETNFEYRSGSVAPVDIFDPVYDQNVVLGDINFSESATRDVAGVYIQDQITLLENLKLLAGGRLDIFEERKTDRLTNIDSTQSDTAFSPRVGLVYQPIEPISLYASYARYFNPVIGTAFSGEFLVPERGTQYEVGIKADLTNRLSTNLAFYELTRTNVTTPDPVNPDFSVQSGKQRSRGIELDISGEILPGWNIIAGYAYTDARVVEDNDIPIGNRLYNAPEHAVNLWTTYRIQDGDLQGLGFGLGIYYIGERPIDNANTVNLPSGSPKQVRMNYSDVQNTRWLQYGYPTF
jgi:iron complex outermembrane recepter protein